jgi:RecB family endonuclease NucS
MTAIGPVDLLCRDADGRAVAVEVKRRGEIDGPMVAGHTYSQSVTRPRHWAIEVKRKATIDAVEQLGRYVELLDRDPLLTPVGGVLAAQTITAQARTLAEDRGFRCVVVDYDALRGMARDELTLF